MYRSLTKVIAFRGWGRDGASHHTGHGVFGGSQGMNSTFFDYIDLQVLGWRHNSRTTEVRVVKDWGIM